MCAFVAALDFVYVVNLKGSVDTETYEELQDELSEIIDEKIKALMLDMEGLDYISSIGIRVVVWAKKELQKRNASFAMVNMQPQIKKVFDAMKILPIFDVFEDMPEADKYIDQIIKEEVEKNRA